MVRFALRSTGLLALVALVAAVVGAQAPPSLNPTAVDKFTARKVVELMEQGHMARPRIDDETSRKWCRSFLKELDPQKNYFTKADVEEFLKEETNLDDHIRDGNVEFARKVLERLVQRCDERYAHEQELLKQTPDFTIDEEIADDFDKLDYPANLEESKERWRKRVKLDWLYEKVDGEEPDEIVRKLTVRYRDRNRNYHQLDNSDLLRIYLSTLTGTFDPHSLYMPPRDEENFFNQTLRLSLFGIGAQLGSEDGYAVIKELIPDGPADKDGRLEPEDKLLGIEKEDGTEISFIEKKLDDVVKEIRGPAGTKVRLIVQPAGTKERKVYELTRDKVQLVEYHAKGAVVPITAEDGKAFKVGVIHLPSFYGDAAAINRRDPDAVSATIDCRRLIRDFKKQGVDAVLLDLRGNAGGLLSEAITLSGLFIDTGPVVQIKDSDGVKSMDDDEEGTAWDGPLVVTIDRLSASASEIFAGVIKDYGRGLILGDATTYGKGTVQQVIGLNDQFLGRNLPKMGALKLTIQQFYRANGESTQIRGVPSDIALPSARDLLGFEGEGERDNAFKFDKVAAMPHDLFNRVSSDLVKRLAARSEARREGNEKFQKLAGQIKKAEERRARHTISLNEAKFRSEYFPEDGEDEEKDKKDKKPRRPSERPAWESDFYNDEIMNIVGDYLTIGSEVLAAAPVRVGQR